MIIMGFWFVDIQRPSKLVGCCGQLHVEKEKTQPRIGNQASISWILQVSPIRCKKKVGPGISRASGAGQLGMHGQETRVLVRCVHWAW